MEDGHYAPAPWLSSQCPVTRYLYSERASRRTTVCSAARR
jgi:hypothetical protein